MNQKTGDFWMEHMLRGEFEEAWKFSDKVLAERAGTPCWHLPRHQQYLWQGDSLAGKRVLVRCYHGLGDTIQFIRFAPLLKKVAKEVTVWAQPPLLPLLNSVSGIDRLLPLHDGTPEVAYDVDVEVMELPHIFRTTVDTIPAQIPYLHVERLPLTGRAGKISVGLVWRASEWDPRRYLPFDALKPLFSIRGVQFFILQAAAKEAGWEEGYGLHPGEVPLATYAQLLRGVNLLITIDSMPAHLAGAMGVPVWTMLHADADWRWMRNRNDSPWYPTMQLFRQQQQGEWKDVISEVKTALENLTQQQAFALPALGEAGGDNC